MSILIRARDTLTFFPVSVSSPVCMKTRNRLTIACALTVARYVRIMIYRSVAFLASAVSCGPSPIPINTQASAATGTYGDVVTYTCIAGYNQSGGGTGRRTCDSSGSWVVDGGDSDPVCSSEIQILHSRKRKRKTKQTKNRLILDIYRSVNCVRHKLIITHSTRWQKSLHSQIQTHNTFFLKIQFIPRLKHEVS